MLNAPLAPLGVAVSADDYRLFVSYTELFLAFFLLFPITSASVQY